MKQHFSTEQRILNRLILESPFLKDTGLFYGQTGIILSLSSLYIRFSNNIYKDIIDVLLDRLIEKLTNDLDTSFDKGVAGIGWVMEFLIQNHLVEGNSLEVCKEFDDRMLKDNILRISDLSLETGLEGLLHYIFAHLQGVWTQNRIYPFDENYLKDVYVKICTLKDEDISSSLISLCSDYKEFYETRKLPLYSFEFSGWIDLNNIDENNLSLRNGLAGLLLTKKDLHEESIYFR